MGVVKRQGLKQSLVRYFGIVLGTINILFLYPLFLGAEKLGLINFILDTAILTHSFVLLGVSSVTVKYFPLFENPANKHNGFLSFILLWASIGFGVFLLCAWFLKPTIVSYYGQKSPEYLLYLPYVIPFILALIYQSVLRNYISNFNRIVIPTLLDQVLKIVVPSLAFLFFYNKIPFSWLIAGIVLYHLTAALGLAMYTFFLGQWKLTSDFSFFTKPILKDIFTYASYAVLGSIGSVLSHKIDGVMVASLIDLSSNGVYKVASFIAIVIRVPSEAIGLIIAPIISKKIAQNDLPEIDKIYKKTSILLWTIGLFFLLGIWTNIDSLFAMMPDGALFSTGKNVILILGIGILSDMLTSVNGHIIAYSKYFRFNFYALLVLAVINVVGNITLIPIFGMNGAALATACSLFLYNLLKLIFVYKKYGMLPFSNKSIHVLILTLSIYFLVNLLPITSIPILDIIWRSALICVLFIPSIIYFDISEDISNAFWQVIDRVKQILGK